MATTVDPDADCTPSERFILFVLEHAAGGLTQTELIKRTGLPPSTVSRSLDRLADRGRIERRPDPSDARRQIVALAEPVTPVHRDDGLRPSDRLVLLTLSSHGGDLPLQTLVETTGLPDRTTRDAAKRLEREGYLERRKCPENPRRYRYALTEHHAEAD